MVMPCLAKVTLLSTLVRRLEFCLSAEATYVAALAPAALSERAAERRAAEAAVAEARRHLARLPAGVAACPPERRQALEAALRAAQDDLAALRRERRAMATRIDGLVADETAADLGIAHVRPARSDTRF
jgi:hypothetical protein